MIIKLRRRVSCNIWAAKLKVKVTAWPNSKIVSGQLFCYLKSDFTKNLHKWSSYWDVSRATFGSLFEGQGHSMTFQHNRVRPITSFFEVYLNTISHKWSPCWDDVSRTTFVSLHMYLEDQGHSMTLQQNSFRPINLWFEVEFYNYFTGLITILRQHVTCNIWVATL